MNKYAYMYTRLSYSYFLSFTQRKRLYFQLLFIKTKGGQWYAKVFYEQLGANVNADFTERSGNTPCGKARVRFIYYFCHVILLYSIVHPSFVSHILVESVKNPA